MFGGTSVPSAFAPASTAQTAFTFPSGNVFGTPAASASQPFGAPAQPATAFSFGTSTAAPFGTTTPAFGTQATAPAFGASTAAPAFGGTTGAPFSFGPTTSSTPFGGTTTSVPFSFGTGTSSAFGTTTTAPFGTTTQPAFSFGATTTATAPAFGTTTSAPFSFGTPAFGATTSAPFSFGTITTPSVGFGNTGSAPFAFSTGCQPQFIPTLQQQAQQQPVDPTTAFYQSIFQCNKFGDERDQILANFNYVQASLGIGKGYYSQTLPPVTYTPTNPLYRFKAIGFTYMYTNNNEDGLVSFDIKKSAEKVRAEDTSLVSRFQTFLNRPNIIFKIAGVKATSEEQSVVNIYAEDQASLRRFPATDLASVINQQHLKPQLDTMGITNISAKVKPSPEQLKRYLETPPDGIDPRVWKQAQDDNPNPDTMVPTPIIGMDALKKRIHNQEMECAHHDARLQMMKEECTSYLQRCANVGAEIIQIKRKECELSLRLLSVLSKLEVSRKGVSALTPEEVELSQRLQTIEDELNSPTEYKGRLMELLSHLRLQHGSGSSGKYTIDESSIHDIKELLMIQQKSLKHLVDTVKNDTASLALIADNVPPPEP